jgi:NADPH:quinone reductase-like Zn-dependent oxidoreductase
MKMASYSRDLMRAVVLTGHGGIEKLQFRDDIAVPQPKGGEVLIKVGACGMNNTDINTRTAWYDRENKRNLSEEMGLHGATELPTSSISDRDAATWNTASLSFPRIQGAAIAGVIVAVGPNVDTAIVGERVLVDPCVRDTKLPPYAQLAAYVGSERDGGFAEFVVVPQENAHKVVAKLSDVELATFPCSYDTAEEMLERARLGRGETVVITGAAGGVGTALIQLSLLRGAKVVAIAGSSKRDQITALGAHKFVSRDEPGVRAQVEKFVGTSSVDVVADVVGGDLFADILKMLRRGGRYTAAGAIGGPVQPMDLRDLIYKDLEMYGITCPTAATFSRVVDYINSGKLKPVLERAFKLEDLREAQAEFVKRRHFGKLVIDMDQDSFV